jgi:hypothetical protein
MGWREGAWGRGHDTEARTRRQALRGIDWRGAVDPDGYPCEGPGTGPQTFRATRSGYSGCGIGAFHVEATAKGLYDGGHHDPAELERRIDRKGMATVTSLFCGGIDPGQIQVLYLARYLQRDPRRGHSEQATGRETPGTTSGETCGPGPASGAAVTSGRQATSLARSDTALAYTTGMASPAPARPTPRQAPGRRHPEPVAGHRPSRPAPATHDTPRSHRLDPDRQHTVAGFPPGNPPGPSQNTPSLHPTGTRPPAPSTRTPPLPVTSTSPAPTQGGIP